MFQASSDLCVTSSSCDPAMVFSLSASTDSIFLCFMERDNSSSEDLNSLLLHLVNKNTLEGNNHFLTSFFPLPHSIAKLRLQELHFRAGVTQRPHRLTYNKQQIVFQFWNRHM